MIPEPAPSARPPPDQVPLASVRSFATVFYLLLLAAGLLWCFARTGRWLPDSVGGGEVGQSAAIGAITAALVIAISAALMRRVIWMRWFAEEIRRLLGPIDTRTALQLALVSGVAEEVFFRGAMQPVLGYVLTSIVFGVVHVGPDRRFLSWTLFAIAMGFALGGMLQVTNSLAGPVVAHVGINFVNLRSIGRMPLLPDRTDEPTGFADSPDQV